MKLYLFIISVLGLMPNLGWATQTAPISPTGSALQMIFGLLVVVAVMLVLAWLLKRYTPGMGTNGGVARVIGGVNVGGRERVVVIEVADRWLVVGVAPGHVSSIANLEANSDELSIHPDSTIPANANPFAKWLAKSLNKPRRGE